MRSFKNLAASALVALPVIVGGAAWADQTDPKLDRLFADLKTAQTTDVAQPLEAEIWQLWSHSTDDRINRLMAVGAAALGTADYSRALSIYGKVVALAPNFAEGWNKRATTLYFMDKYDESESDIAHVLALEPRHFGALSGLGMCAVRLSQTRQAIEALRRAQAINPNLPGIAGNIDALQKQLARESI